jgi:hypothetical protein
MRPKNHFMRLIAIAGLGMIVNSVLAEPAVFTFKSAAQFSTMGLQPGLSASVWHVSDAPDDLASPSKVFTDAEVGNDASSADLTAVEKVVNNHAIKPGYSFINTKNSFSYNGGDSATNVFLGDDAAGAASTDTSAWHNSIIDQIGYIYIPAPGAYTFNLPSTDAPQNDDATRVYIGGDGTPGTGTNVVENNYSNNLR